MRQINSLIYFCSISLACSVKASAQYIHILNCKEENGKRDTVFLFNPYSAGAVLRASPGIAPTGTEVDAPYNAKIPENEVVGLDTLAFYAADGCQILGTDAYARMVLPTVKELYIYMKENLQYPKSLENKGIHGYVPIAFTIKSGEAPRDVRVLRSLHPLLDKEAIRLVRNIPASHWLVPAPREFRGMIFWGTYQCRMLVKF